MNEPNRIEDEEDYISSSRYDNSIKKIREKYPNGCPDHVIATVLEQTEEWVKKMYQKVISNLRKRMKAE
jgi:hypothetical protein